MLTALDDTLWHQLPTTFDHVGTSDPRFFDRYWFAANAEDGRVALQLTMGLYRNMNVVDAALAVIVDGKQHNLRASRTLGDLNETVCGPLLIEVLEPLRKFRLIARGEQSDIRAEIIWTGVVPPLEEAPHFKRQNGRVVEDYQRFNQIGTASGWIEVAGERLSLDDWWACRDHSWGVRPRIGIPEPRTGAVDSLSQRGFTMAFLFFSTEQLAGTLLFMQREGEEAYTSGAVTDRSSRVVQSVLSVALTAELVPGTRRFSQVESTTELADGRQLVLTCRRSGAAIAMQGLGYSGGYRDRQGLGAWRGDMLVERDTWDVSHPATIVYSGDSSNEHWHRIQPVQVEATMDGQRGRGAGSMTVILSGKIASMGLE
jgi:hypothetical protein